MKTTDLEQFIRCDAQADGTIRIRSRERADLEFKQDIGDNEVRKSVRTVAAFANADGGIIVFGVTDSPRTVCGVDPATVPDESRLQDLLARHLVPVPDIEITEHEIGGKTVIALHVAKARQQPVIAIRDLQTSDKKNKTVLTGGCVYYRRSGQSRPITGEEFISILTRRDDLVRNTIMNFILRGQKVGFENASVADFRGHAGDSQVTVYLPPEAARDLNVVDRARLVEDGGAPAYEIRGTVALTTPPKKDPRKPLLPGPSARALRPEIEGIFWPGFPWSYNHLRQAAAHLGFWPSKEGDDKHTGVEQVANNPIYYERGRKAILSFARSNPDEFVDVVGSKSTKAEWRRRKSTGELADQD